MIDVSVVVCTRDRPQELARCLGALAGLTPPPDETIVVDNSADPAQSREVAARHGVRVLHDGRGGVSFARNTGARDARCEVVAYVDDDAVPEPDFVAALRETFADPSVSAAAGRVVALERSTQADLGEVPHRFDRSTPDWFGRSNFGGIGIGCNMAFRRAVFEDGHRFCEWLGVGSRIPGGEEHYIFFELLRDGHTVVYEPSVLVRHDDAADPLAVRRRQHRMFEAALPYAVALLVQEPGFRIMTLRYLAGGLRGRPRAWRTPVESSGWHPSRALLVAVAARAPFRYAWSRIAARRSR